MDGIDTKRFINEVRKKRAIWDSSSEEYKDRNQKKDQWTEICVKFHPDFEELDVTEKVNIGNELQRKWRHLRDAYVRSMRNKIATSTQGRKSIKTYVYARHLEFLRGITTPRKTESSQQPEASMVSGDEGNTEDDDDDDNENEVTFVRNRHVERQRTQTEQRRKYFSSTINGRRNRRLEQKIEDFIDNYQREKDHRPESQSCDDLDFFRSILPLIKPLPLPQKIQFRMDAMKMALEYSERSQQHLPPEPQVSTKQENIYETYHI